MKYLKTIGQLEELQQSQKLILVIFVDPNEFMPAKSLLNYLFAHPLMRHVDQYVYIWNLIDQDIYQRFQIVAFPQMTLLRGQQPLYSFIGYNREQASEALERLCVELGLGKPQKQLNLKLIRCANNHEMSLTGQSKNNTYAGGCYKCNSCHKLAHFDKERPHLHCQYCSFDICPHCCYEDILA